MKLAGWLKKNEIEITRFAKIIGVTRQVIWKAKNNMPIEPITAYKILFATGGCVKLIERAKGRKKGSKLNKKL